MITLYTCGASPYSHSTRIVLAEKELPVEMIEVEPSDKPAKLLELNPYGKLPTLLDRDTVLFESTVVNEYLDERYPHPPLKPGSPAERAQMRLWVLRAHDELYSLYFKLADGKATDETVKQMQSYLEAMDVFLARQPYFVEGLYTLADVTVAPILWRFPTIGVETDKMPNLEAYMDSLFERPAFERALSEHEQMMHG
jgi:RNA polymerase-associated protein